jgi:pimeloyl-ACP methyl ester carboxylesterase
METVPCDGPGRHPKEAAVRTALRWFLGALVTLSVASTASAQPIPGTCDEGQFDTTGARWKICVPLAGWNHNLIVFAHGYVFDVPGAGLDFFDTLPDGTSLSTLTQSLGFAYATTSYRQNGLAILEGTDDVRDVVALFKSRVGDPVRTFMTGASEGGLVATLLAERSPELFTGAYALCGPIGSFREQVNYVGDFRVLFDYFFPGVFFGSAVDIAPADVQMWLAGITPALIAARLQAEPQKAIELMRTARAAFDPANLTTIGQTTLTVLRYNILGFDDAVSKLGGQPFDNRLRLYLGSSNDFRLNRLVPRFAADAAAVQALRSYNTSGALSIPLVTLHTTSDEAVPFGHELLYLVKVRPTARGRFIPLPVFRYGHCNLTSQEILTGLGVLLAQR